MPDTHCCRFYFIHISYRVGRNPVTAAAARSVQKGHAADSGIAGDKQVLWMDTFNYYVNSAAEVGGIQALFSVPGGIAGKRKPV